MWRKTYARIVNEYRQYDDPLRMTCVLSDGQTVYAFRQSTDQQSPTLYHSSRLDNGGHGLASEPLNNQSDDRSAVKEEAFPSQPLFLDLTDFIERVEPACPKERWSLNPRRSLSIDSACGYE